ncbi:unnamed protein product [Darwinula stevensoni]|uniref:Nose resistant-to-fluoxetine protein N-terminal domain-containing protein n=1 Tax=Darwinula stevensoni TaxID=69355 RepID=A0A7R9FTX7_9CRUS|nr:unnamed protein product [Darwinula stevensoni]CAG0906602.1 unnamed protein product [Darwinula stevensoni]
MLGLLVDLYPSEAGGAGPECLAHTKALFSELGSPNVSDWALQMVDATGKAPSGILTGNVWGMGNFHECLGVRAALDAEENVTELQFSGKYCLVSFDLHIEDQPSTRSGDFILNLGGLAAGAGMNNIPILIEGICLPSSCSNQDLFVSLHRDENK